MIDDDPVERGHRDDDAESRALRQDGGRQRSLLVREPFVDGVRRHRECGTLASAENDATDHQRGEADFADHRELDQRPDEREANQKPARLDPVGHEADDDRRNRKQKEEGGAEQTELAGMQLQLLHDRHAGETDHDLVGEIHDHVEEQERGDLPRAFRRRLSGHARPFLVVTFPGRPCCSGLGAACPIGKGSQGILPGPLARSGRAPKSVSDAGQTDASQPTGALWPDIPAQRPHVAHWRICHAYIRSVPPLSFHRRLRSPVFDARSGRGRRAHVLPAL